MKRNNTVFHFDIAIYHLCVQSFAHFELIQSLALSLTLLRFLDFPESPSTNWIFKYPDTTFLWLDSIKWNLIIFCSLNFSSFAIMRARKCYFESDTLSWFNRNKVGEKRRKFNNSYHWIRCCEISCWNNCCNNNDKYHWNIMFVCILKLTFSIEKTSFTFNYLMNIFRIRLHTNFLTCLVRSLAV